ncbi:SOS response-associated peptidase [Terriglobus aquaticus]|uniref:SOS response-associated peptidase n=1 Tax=Terriglobus aquaticus TaxID=940139 RepID=A0ABW9KGZ1_9BACT|nr:SOS response-associated peptidase [Terriglobus aquaticus]
MCGRYRRRSDKQRIAEVFHAAVGDLSDLNFAPDDDIRLTTTQPIIRMNRDSGDRELIPAGWGFIPSWQKPSEKFPPTTFNAVPRASRKPGCGATGSFYEWHKIRAKNNPKYENRHSRRPAVRVRGLVGYLTGNTG